MDLSLIVIVQAPTFVFARRAIFYFCISPSSAFYTDTLCTVALSSNLRTKSPEHHVLKFIGRTFS